MVNEEPKSGEVESHCRQKIDVLLKASTAMVATWVGTFWYILVHWHMIGYGGI